MIFVARDARLESQGWTAIATCRVCGAESAMPEGKPWEFVFLKCGCGDMDVGADVVLRHRSGLVSRDKNTRVFPGEILTVNSIRSASIPVSDVGAQQLPSNLPPNEPSEKPATGHSREYRDAPELIAAPVWAMVRAGKGALGCTFFATEAPE